MTSNDPIPYDLYAAERDFDRISDALSFLGDFWRDHPDLDSAARSAGLSPHHFQRIFSRWVGVSPKKYVGALAHSAAREAIDGGANILDASFEAGLSGPGRLHDLFIAHEQVTPGQARAKGAGLGFLWGTAPTPFGNGVFLVAPRGLSALAFADPSVESAFEDLRARYPAAEYVRDDGEALRWAERIFAEGDGPIPLALYGTPWQRQVWRALLTIPAGQTVTYRDIAAEVCTPKASRAVGAAVGANPVSWLIPCHRVLASDGRLTGYHWGVNRKRAMLAYEAASA
ncbi:bifunctional helix-turn-helix domain-containing protein/methylated-DNA--[protein]-cysteine S-methyltransferase [Hyphobacterium sp. HN65]|uniref:Bifunctional helix-turn-helix domain-containing protein/methylated-DNA--[protein]-cysteine S-methyltransferase n=1 Tax=Hyphobacterium lacteum TaxID=3116575 RepID=A0ABU7LTH5_9PROT|nr:bifunctional helix-turn-helix domain-containing protein/methylated-DNA--[protein]-cysteine S-methyltransferase [Hyphobacterium sp. HN65]MEE2526649.1 bifunctional helix-turn-helix domain-containing protein/methylated-DNA--[protein]-cysteine S-methyltransferase [Hyphobacterium sp. HN65]